MIGLRVYAMDGAIVMEGQQPKSAPDRLVEAHGHGAPTLYELTAEREDGRYVYRELHPELAKFTKGWQPGRRRPCYRPQ